MTVLQVVSVRRLPYRGYDAPALPTGIWWASGTVVGDASGGTMQVRAEFKAEGAPVSGEFWNLEQFSALVSDASNNAGFLGTVGLTPSRGLPGFDRDWRILIQSIGALVGNAAVGDIRPQLPIFLGAVRGGVDTLGALAIGIDNLTATDSLSASMMGYVWDARSILAEGGPQRPVGSLFGHGA